MREHANCLRYLAVESFLKPVQFHRLHLSLEVLRERPTVTGEIPLVVRIKSSRDI